MLTLFVAAARDICSSCPRFLPIRSLGLTSLSVLAMPWPESIWIFGRRTLWQLIYPASIAASRTHLTLAAPGPPLCQPRPFGKRTPLRPTLRKRNPPWLQRNLCSSAFGVVSCTRKLWEEPVKQPVREKTTCGQKKRVEQVYDRATVCDQVHCPPSTFPVQ